MSCGKTTEASADEDDAVDTSGRLEPRETIVEILEESAHCLFWYAEKDRTSADEAAALRETLWLTP
ncbi:MAG: hypothetical protein HRU30_06315 [Rhodobacteraceae bacterium]|nr:hypothetical protein [Paracoccaceae bacterium]